MKIFVLSLTGIVGFKATVASNIPDFTRYAKSQRAQMLGQALGLPIAITLYSFLGVAIWDAVVVLGQFHQSLLASVARVALVVATLNTNVAANVVSPSNCFSNLNPKLISFRAGGLITGVAGIAMMLWKLLGDFSACILGWFEGYSGLLRPIAKGMIADYFLIRNRKLSVPELYQRGGQYQYSNGINYRAMAALNADIVAALPGLVVPSLRW